MLPILRRRQEASVQVPDEKIRRTPDHEEEYDSMESAAEDLHSAMKSGDIKGIASALRSAFHLADSEPHEEGEPIQGEEE